MDIAKLVERCSQEFVGQTDALEEKDLRDALAKEHSRFKIWVGILSAHRASGHRSLEYRLRDSQNLRTRVLSLLQDLFNELQRFGNGGSDLYLDDGLSEGEIEGFEVEYVPYRDAPHQSLAEVKSIIDLMYRFAMTLQNPASHSRIRDALLSSAVVYRPYDIRHIQDKFPTADESLVERLARAVSTWRQYIRYREDHYDKQAAVGNAGDDTTTVATSLPQRPANEAQGQKSVQMGLTLIDPAQPAYSQTSFAPTTSGNASLRPPPLPEAGSAGQPFQCEICCDLVSFESEHEWRRHVFEDIPPYVCLNLTCATANKVYTRRREWQQHMQKSHHQTWICPFQCSSDFSESNLLLDHIVSEHGQNQDPTDLCGLLESCAQPNTHSLDLHCPLCTLLTGSPRIWFKHVGHHLEELACYALPAKVYGDNPDEESESDDANEPRVRNHLRLDSVSSVDSLEYLQSQARQDESEQYNLAHSSTTRSKPSKRLSFDTAYRPLMENLDIDPESMQTRYLQHDAGDTQRPSRGLDVPMQDRDLSNAFEDTQTQQPFAPPQPAFDSINEAAAQYTFEGSQLQYQHGDFQQYFPELDGPMHDPQPPNPDSQYQPLPTTPATISPQALSNENLGYHHLASWLPLGYMELAGSVGDPGLPRLDTRHLPTSGEFPSVSSQPISPQRHGKEDIIPSDLNCVQCSAAFSTQAALSHHLRSHLSYNARAHVCPHCGKRFQYQKDLSRHVPRHDPNRQKFFCGFSGCKWNMKGFGRQDHLDRHIASHHVMDDPMQLSRAHTPSPPTSPQQ